MWPQLEQLAQSVVYDATITTELQRPTPEMQAVTIPTLVLRGEPTWPLLATAAQEITERLSNAELQVVPGDAVHGIDPTGTAAAIRRFEV
jgi:pimeloyl-ACP methyl ester carboxylesterase